MTSTWTLLGYHSLGLAYVKTRCAKGPSPLQIVKEAGSGKYIEILATLALVLTSTFANARNMYTVSEVQNFEEANNPYEDAF